MSLVSELKTIADYNPTAYVNNSEPDLDAEHLNKTEQALKRVTDAANDAINALKELEEQKLSLNAIVQTESTATDKVPSSAYLKQALGTINSNLEGYYKLSGGTAIPNGANLTGYKTPGNYYCPNNTVAASLIGSPTQKAFTLKVEFSTGNSYPCQTIRDFATGKIYFRTFNIDTNAWSEWGYSIQNADMESKQITSTTDSNGLVSVGAKYPDYKKVVCTTTRTATIMHVYHNDSEWRAKAVDTSNNAIANATITINCIAFK